MTLAKLIKKFRVLAFDETEPYLFDDDKIIDWLNEAQKEACLRGRLIHDSETVDVCIIDVTAGEVNYPLHPSLYEITHASIDNLGVREPLCLVSFEDMGDIDKDWRYNKDSTKGYHLIQFDTYVRLSKPTQDDTKLYLEGYRTPLMVMQADDDTPEINQIHHDYLLYWALHRAFGIPDSEVFDLNKAEMAQMQFTQYFGIRPDSDLRRITRHDVPHTVQGFWV